MKIVKIVPALVLLFSLIFASCIHTIGNGWVKSVKINVAPFEKIENSSPGIIRYHRSNEHRVILNIDSNLEKYVSIVSENNTLKIDKKNTHLTVLTINYVIDVYAPSISAISISGSGNFNGNIKCENISARGSGSGEIIIMGNSQNADIIMSGSGRFRGSEFIANNAILTVRGSGSITIHVTDYIKANISGSGNIIYQGTPAIDYSRNGSGRLINNPALKGRGMLFR